MNRVHWNGFIPKVIILVLAGSFWLQLLQLETVAFAVNADSAFREMKLEKIHDLAPDFTMTDSERHQVKFSSFLRTSVILHFWATWCESCRKELPELKEMVSSVTGKDVAFIAVSIDDETQRKSVKRYLAEIKFVSPVWIAEKNSKFDRFITWGIPATYFILPSGQILARALGPRNWLSIPHIQELISAVFKLRPG